MRIKSTLFLLLFAASAGAQQGTSGYSLEHFNKNFPHYITRNIAQDKYGFLWIVSGNGLCKYDGYHTTTYNFSTGYYGIRSYIQEIVPIEDGSVWIFGGKTVDMYNPITNKIEWLHLDSVLTKDEAFSGICYDSGLIWAGSNKGRLFIINPLKKEAKFFKSFGKTPIQQIIRGSKGRLWFSNLSSLYEYNNGKIDSVKTNYIITCLFEDQHHHLWAGSQNGLWQLDSKKLINRGFEYLFNTSINCINEIKPDELWIGTEDNGLYIFQLRKNNTFHLLHDDANPKSLCSNVIYKIFKDHSDVVWISTPYYMNKVDLHKKQFKFITNKEDNTFMTKGFSSVMEDSHGLIWYLTLDNKINIIEKATSRRIKINQPIITKTGLSYSEVIEDSLGFVWIMSWNLGVIKIYPPKMPLGSFAYLPYKYYSRYKDTASLGGWAYRSIIADDQNDIYIGSLNPIGLEIYNRKLFKFEPIHKPRFGIWSMCDDHKGNLQICTVDSGLCIFNKKTQKSILLKHDPKNLNSISSNATRSIAVASDGTVWVGTLSGLNRIDINGKIRRYYEEDGLCNNSIVGIIEDDSKNIWLSTDNGLSCFNPATGTFRNYYVSDGLATNQYMYNACYKNKKGWLYFGGVDGIVSFDPMAIPDNPVKPVPCITGIRIFNTTVNPGDTVRGQVILKESIITAKKIRLNYQERDLVIDFSALHYANPLKNRFTYLLEGYDKEWKMTIPPQHTATYTNLPPGSYTFKVKASNNDQVWSTQEATIDVIIDPPFWRSVWFMSLAAMAALMALIFIIIRTVRKRKHLQKLVDQKTVELRTQADVLKNVNEELHQNNDKLQQLTEELRTQSEDLSNANESLIKLNETKEKLFTVIAQDLRVPLQSVVDEVELLYNQHEKLKEEEKKNHLFTLLSTSNAANAMLENLLEWSKTQAEKVSFEPKSINIKEIVQSAIHGLSSQIDKKQLTLHIEKCDPYARAYADKNMIAIVIRNILSNAIKFTSPRGRIAISTTINEPYMELSFTDSGVGMSEDELQKIFKIDKSGKVGTMGETGTGLGLVISKELLKINHGEIIVNSKAGEGSCITVCMTLTENYFKTAQPLTVEATHFVTRDDDEIKEENKEAQSDPKKQYILVIEDNTGIRANIKQSLSEKYNISEANDGKTGFNMASEIMPDLIICDASTSEMDGFQLCKEIKKDEHLSHIPVILLISGNQDQDKKKLDTGADDYIPKPCNTKILESRIQSLLQNKQLLRRRYKMDKNLSPIAVASTSTDKNFATRLTAFMEAHLADEHYSLEKLAADLKFQPKQLSFKMEGLFGMSVSEFMKDYRLKKAATMLEAGLMSIAEIARAVGFSNLALFTNLFHKKFGKTPSGYIEKI